jgi:hypothetical protein
MDTYSITLNKPFIYINDTIESESNLFSIPTIKNEISIFSNTMVFAGSGRGSDEVIEFSDEFIHNSQFDNESYQIIFSCETSDNRQFIKNIEIKFNTNNK